MKKIDYPKGFICLIYPIMALLWFLGVVFGGLKMEIIIAAFLIMGACSVTVLNYFTIKLTEDKVFGLYLLYNVLSGIWCICFGMPPIFYARELAFTVVPMVYYYAGRGLDRKDTLWFYRNFVFSTAFLAALTAFLYFSGSVFYPMLHDGIWSGFSSISEGFGERSESWIAAVNNMENFWIGDGLGSHGLRTAGYQMYPVSDGGLVKLYSEMGLIGTSMIIFVLALVYIKSFRKKKLFPEIVIITAAILVSAVVNLLEMVLFMPIVFFALGRAVRLVNDEDAGEEYVGPFEDPAYTENEDDGMEEAPSGGEA